MHAQVAERNIYLSWPSKTQGSEDLHGDCYDSSSPKELPTPRSRVQLCHNVKEVDDVWVVRVADHKISMLGMAKLTMDREMKERVDKYFSLV